MAAARREAASGKVRYTPAIGKLAAAISAIRANRRPIREIAERIFKLMPVIEVHLLQRRTRPWESTFPSTNWCWPQAMSSAAQK
jgi:hypothetical protein